MEDTSIHSWIKSSYPPYPRYWYFYISKLIPVYWHHYLAARQILYPSSTSIPTFSTKSPLFPLLYLVALVNIICSASPASFEPTLCVCISLHHLLLAYWWLIDSTMTYPRRLLLSRPVWALNSSSNDILMNNECRSREKWMAPNARKKQPNFLYNVKPRLNEP